MNDLIPFQYQDHQVRTINKNGEPWFVLKDVSEILGIQNHKDISSRLDIDERGVDSIDTLGGIQYMITINESGLYNVILRSDKPEAKQFRKWITSEVLPSIRRHGMYATPVTIESMLSDPDTMIRTLTALKDERAARIAAENTVKIQAPKVLFADSVAGSADGILVRDMAKILHQNGFDIGEKRFYDWLRKHGYVIKNEGRDKNMPTQKSVELGVMDIREGTRINPEGVVKPLKTTLVTGKGQIYFVNKFKEYERMSDS